MTTSKKAGQLKDVLQQLREEGIDNLSDLQKDIIQKAQDDPNAEVVMVDIAEIRRTGNLDHLDIPEDAKADLLEQLQREGILTTH